MEVGPEPFITDRDYSQEREKKILTTEKRLSGPEPKKLEKEKTGLCYQMTNSWSEQRNPKMAIIRINIISNPFCPASNHPDLLTAAASLKASTSCSKSSSPSQSSSYSEHSRTHISHLQNWPLSPTMSSVTVSNSSAANLEYRQKLFLTHLGKAPIWVCVSRYNSHCKTFARNIRNFGGF